VNQLLQLRAAQEIHASVDTTKLEPSANAESAGKGKKELASRVTTLGEFSPNG
jgi:hypothetical protein